MRFVVSSTLVLLFHSGLGTLAARLLGNQSPHAFVYRQPDSRCDPLLLSRGTKIFSSLGGEGSNSNENAKSLKPDVELFPVLSRIANTEWTGACRYVGADLALMNIRLVGGVRYDILENTVRLSSFLTFPNGKTREVVMQGERSSTDDVLKPLKLSSLEPGGPIHMLLSEVRPDTIIINEVEEANGSTILTSSLSIVEGQNGSMELVQVSHEVGGEGDAPIEGHQIWRLKKNAPIEYDDFNMNGASAGR